MATPLGTFCADVTKALAEERLQVDVIGRLKRDMCAQTGHNSGSCLLVKWVLPIRMRSSKWEQGSTWQPPLCVPPGSHAGQLYAHSRCSQYSKRHLPAGEEILGCVFCARHPGPGCPAAQL